MTLAEAAAQAPQRSGVYFLLGADTALLYIGKAGSLRHRLIQHARAAPGPREPRRATLYQRVVEVRWIELPDEPAAALREADLIAALRPPFTAESSVARRWPYLLTEPLTGDRLRFRLAPSVDGRGYGCFPHLGRGLGSPPGVACSDGYTALLRLLWAASDAPGSTFPSTITHSAPDTFTVPVAEPLRTPLHRYLSGTSRRLLDSLATATGHRNPYLHRGLARDLDAAARFFDVGPQALRRMRLRHRQPAGPLTQSVLEQLFVAEVRAAIGAFRLPDPPDAADAHLARKAQPWK